MFAGIVESMSSIMAAHQGQGQLTIMVEKPSDFNDLELGDSIAVDGLCLTVENLKEDQIQFTLAPESLRVTGWTSMGVLGRVVNLERSLRLGSRIHGHLVTGHVDGLARVRAIEKEGETMALEIETPRSLRPYIWSKGSVALNGVSLTINRVTPESFSVGLIPETLKRTNLSRIQIDDALHLEVDNLARGLVHNLQEVRI
ncbi:MAG: riboflavin synthase [Bdellovibrionales bacterium]